jgi:hypothetical protein
MKFYMILPLLLSIVFTSCATTSARILPGENNINRAIARGTYKDDTVEKAIDSAKDYCREKKQGVIYLNDINTNYEGYMSEGTKKGTRQISKAATFTGLGLEAVSKPLGSVVFGAGVAGLFITDDKDYVAELGFKCQ